MQGTLARVDISALLGQPFRVLGFEFQVRRGELLGGGDGAVEVEEAGVVLGKAEGGREGLGGLKEGASIDVAEGAGGEVVGQVRPGQGGQGGWRRELRARDLEGEVGEGGAETDDECEGIVAGRRRWRLCHESALHGMDAAGLAVIR